MSQERIDTSRSHEDEVSDRTDEQNRAVGEQALSVSEISDDTNALIDEIDEVLEANAEEFMTGYVQQGGQ